MYISVYDGIVVGAAGGAAAGIIVWLVQVLKEKFQDKCDERSVFNWLSSSTFGDIGQSFRSTKAIASFNNLTLARAEYICSRHPKIFLSVGNSEDVWGITNSAFPRKDNFVDAR